jgi:hypothetical protein
MASKCVVAEDVVTSFSTNEKAPLMRLKVRSLRRAVKGATADRTTVGTTRSGWRAPVAALVDRAE